MVLAIAYFSWLTMILFLDRMSSHMHKFKKLQSALMNSVSVRKISLLVIYICEIPIGTKILSVRLWRHRKVIKLTHAMWVLVFTSACDWSDLQQNFFF